MNSSDQMESLLENMGVAPQKTNDVLIQAIVCGIESVIRNCVNVLIILLMFGCASNSFERMVFVGITLIYRKILDQHRLNAKTHYAYNELLVKNLLQIKDVLKNRSDQTSSQMNELSKQFSLPMKTANTIETIFVWIFWLIILYNVFLIFKN